MAPVRPVKLIKIDQAISKDFLSYPAVIQSKQLSVLAFEVGGKLKDLMVVEAQKVEKGEVLAKLDQRDLQTKLQSVRAQFEHANTEYQRALRLIKQDAISRSELEQRKSQYDVNKAQFITAKKALQDSELVAPYMGRIASVSIKKQQVIQPGKPAISILGKEGLEAAINLPSVIIANAGGKKNSTTSAYLVLEAAPARRIPATYKEVTLEADAVSQTYEVTFSFDAPEGFVVLPGMNAVVWMKDPRISEVDIRKISIPLTAITTDGDQHYVWIVNRDSMTVSRRAVAIEAGIGIELNVTDGLAPGETIVAAGVSYLAEGMQVRPWLK